MARTITEADLLAALDDELSEHIEALNEAEGETEVGAALEGLETWTAKLREAFSTNSKTARSLSQKAAKAISLGRARLKSIQAQTMTPEPPKPELVDPPSPPVTSTLTPSDLIPPSEQPDPPTPEADLIAEAMKEPEQSASPTIEEAPTPSPPAPAPAPPTSKYRRL